MTDLHPRLDETLDVWAEEFGMPKETIVKQIDIQYGLDLEEVDDDDAESFVDALEEADEETLRELLLKYDVPEEKVDEFSAQVEEFKADDDQPDPEEGNGDAPTEVESPGESESSGGSSGGDGLTRQEVEQMIQQRNEELLSQLEQRLGNQGGGQPQGGQGGGMNQQQEVALRLAEHFMKDGGGAGPMGEMGEKAVEKVMERSMERLSEPTFSERMGEALEHRIIEKVADEEAENLLSDDDEDDDKWWK